MNVQRCKSCSGWKHGKTLEQGMYSRVLLKLCSVTGNEVKPSDTCLSWVVAEKDTKCINCSHITFTVPGIIPPDGVGATCEYKGWVPSIRSKKSCKQHEFREVA